MSFAERLDEAERTRTAIPQVVSQSGADADEAYRIQAALVARRVSRGERLVGIKLGLTSRAKMAQVGVDQVIWGRLTDAMRIGDGGAVDTGRYIHPRVEPEVAFRLDATGAATAVAPALEILDSRYAGFKFALPDVIADNTSAAAFVIGAWQPLPVGLDNLGVLLEVNGRIAQIGSTAAILGDPRRALTAAVTLASRAGVPLEDGWVLLAGAATAAVPLAPGAHVRAVVEALGTASLRALS
ncbi:4-oxalocrotonate decarboxylase [Dactylosporangium sp. NPDC000555]|uniref:2-keto-4-pentenoate hydratase n=1 Tax=Dactylosporangium sp. NPDC000555 TaxID=3154260 RepID=UPI00331C0ADE